MDVLAKLINEGKESLYIKRLDAPPGTDIFDLKHVVDTGLANSVGCLTAEYKQLGDIRSIDLTGVHRCSTHTNQFHRLRKPPGGGKQSYCKCSG